MPVAIGLVITIACSSSDDEQPKVSVEETRQVVQTSYGTRGTDMSWPEMPSDSVAHADNLLSKNYMFVLDASGSMSDRTCTDRRDKMEEAKSAIMAFGESLDADSNIGLLAFSGNDISIVLPLSKYNEAALKEALRAVGPDGSTPLADAMDMAKNA